LEGNLVDKHTQPGVTLARLPGEQIIIKRDKPGAPAIVVTYDCGAKNYGYLLVSVNDGQPITKRLQVLAEAISLRPPGWRKAGPAPVRIQIDKLGENRAYIRVLAPQEFVILRGELVPQEQELDLSQFDEAESGDDHDDFDDEAEDDDFGDDRDEDFDEDEDDEDDEEYEEDPRGA
jgi:hypothetical protein